MLFFSCPTPHLFFQAPSQKAKKMYLGGGFEYVLFSPRNLGKIPILTKMFSNWVGSTTN